MYKRWTSVLLCLLLLLGITLPVYAEENPEQGAVPVKELRISTPEEFASFAGNCRLDSYSRNLAVTLERDLDLSGTDFEPVPIFSGSFDGKGHTISGLSITADGSAQGLFRYLTADAVVRDLSVQGEIDPGGSGNEIGAVAGRNEGQILNCSFSGTVSGGDYVGGIAGTNAVTGIIDSCRTNGDIYGDHFVGGIAGENTGVIRGCANYAAINTTPQQNSIELSDITMDSLTSTESANTVTDIGGIAGISGGVLRECDNFGDVGYRHMGYNIGGIAGTQSGYIADCENHGSVQGRKEVGGIVGQMEPASLIEYTEDTLQILRGQLDDLSGLVNQASGNAKTNANQISSQIGLLQDQTQTARDAVETLLPDTDDPQLPDMDTVLAAQNSLSTAIGAMPGTVRGIASATQTTVNSLTRDLNAVSGQISAMSQTLHNASENLGGSITDVSDMDTPEMLAGKVEACVNYGGVLADLNLGGIAGAVAMENDLDILEDWERNGEESLNFRSELRAVILDCRNDGTVTGTKQNVGGIAGWQSLGLVRNSENTGKIDAADAEYVGGISGLSTGYIRDGYAKCEIRGKSCVGGIAGSGTIATDCISMVQLLGGNEKLGAILGSAEESTVQDGAPPISGNIYPRLIEDAGAIDGISYAGLAEGMALDAFLALENLPELFRSVTVRFAFEEGSEKRIQLRPGSSLAADRIPGIPEKDGFTALWEGLENTDLGSIACDMRFEAAYIPCRTAIQSGQTRDSGLPLVLAEGVFTASAAVSAEASGEVPGLTEKETLLEVWTIHVPDGAEAVRFLLPDGAEDPKLLLRRPDGIWSEAAYARDESYLVVRMTAGDVQLALVQAQTDPPVLLTAGISLAALALLAAALIRRKRSRQRTPPSPRC